MSPKIVQTIILDYSTEVNCKNSLTLIRLFYNYFLTENPNLHAVYTVSQGWFEWHFPRYTHFFRLRQKY
jgi:hypothetical protein